MAKIHKWQELGLKRGDTLLCSGRSPMSRGIQKFQRLTGAKGQAAELSHVAEYWDTIRITREYNPRVYESTTMNEWAGKAGVQLNPFQEWLDNYNGDVWVQKWDFERTIDYYHKDDVFICEHADDLYENGIPGALELFLCGLRLHRYVRWAFPDYTPDFTSEPHCTELIALKKKYHGHLRNSAVVNRLPPWIWWDLIGQFTDIPRSEPILIKSI